MDGTGTRGAGGVQNALRVQVALRRRSRANTNTDIGHGDVKRVGVGLGIHSDRAQAQGFQTADNTAGNGAAVGD